jgi:peptidase C25-like protein/VCBS repeat protein
MERIARLQVNVELEPAGAEDVVRRERIVREWESAPPDPSDPRVVSASPDGAVAQPFKATQVPSLLGSPVAYVIVTTDALAPTFQQLADWKTQAGLPAVVRTVSFIRSQYPDGTDDADKIRKFLRDAYARWGTAWVLLGGDPSQVPVRTAYSTFCVDGNCTPTPMNDIITDEYYSCLDGNWNADGDTFYGEGQPIGGAAGGDACDLLPDVYVGRAPVTTVTEAQRFVNRTLQYEKTPVGDYENQVLFFSEVLFPEDWTSGDPITLDGATASESVLPSIKTNAALRYGRLYQNYTDPQWEPGALPESRQAVIDSLNTGYNLAMHVGHGFRDVASCGDANLTSQDAIALQNGNRLTNTYMANCTSNAIDLACLGRAMMSGANGGSVTNIGSTRLDFPTVGSLFEKEYFRLVFETHTTAVGEAEAKQKLPYVPYATGDNAYRWMIMTMMLLGDPELRLWTSRPKTLAVTYPASIPADATSLNVTVTSGGSPVAGARVTAYKVSDEYRVGTTNASGQVTLPFRPDGTGTFTLTVTGYDCRPFQATVTVTAASGPLLAEQPLTIDDDALNGTNGNGNGIIEAGETVDLRVPLKNVGLATANTVNGTLTTTDGLVSVITGTNSYGSIAVNATATGATWFRISTPLTAGDQREIPFTLTATDAALHTFIETFQVTLRAPEMRHVSHTVTEIIGNGNGRPETGETVDYAVRLRNTGTGSASGVTAILRDYDGLATITDSTATFGTIGAGGEVTADPFRFMLSGAATMELRISTQYGLLTTQTVNFTWPATPTGLKATPGPGAISLKWTPNGETDLSGYLVYRSSLSGGPYVQVTPLPTDVTSYVTDAGLNPLTRYFYKIAAVDQSGNISPQTPSVFGYSNPGYHAPFPIQLGPSAGTTQSSVTVARIHQAGKMDILAGSDVLYDLNPDGTGPVDADLQASTVGDFTTFGKNYAGGATVADIDGGGLDILAATWDTKKVYLFDSQGVVKPGWPFTTAAETFSTPAVWDLDGDGKKEIFFGNNGPYLYGLKYNGTEWMDGDANPATNGVFKALGGGFNYGTPAIADVDGNLQPDIVYGASDGNLYAWRPNGTNLPGFPVALGGPVYGSVALGYLDGASDTQMDIVVAAGGVCDSLFVYLANGTRRPGFPVPLKSSGGFGKGPSPALADIDGDGFLDIVAAGTDGMLKVFDRNGALLPAFANVRFSSLTDAATESSPVVADINGDGSPDIVIGDDNGVLSAYGADGSMLIGFPIHVPGEIKGTPALCDCDGDGLTEIALVGWDSRLYVWDYDFAFSPGGPAPWPQFHHDAMHTGFASALTVLDVPVQEAPRALRLMPPSPNPASGRVQLSYEVPAALVGQPLAVEVFDLAGRRVRHLAGGVAAAGRFPLVWDLRSAGTGRADPGVYLVRLKIGATVQSQRVVVLP